MNITKTALKTLSGSVTEQEPTEPQHFYQRRNYCRAALAPITKSNPQYIAVKYFGVNVIKNNFVGIRLKTLFHDDALKQLKIL
jgi:hypothetical protein